MGGSRFSRGDALQFGWETAKRNLGFFVVLLIVLGIINGVAATIEKLGRENAGLALLAILTYAAASVITGVGMIRAGLRFSDGARPQLAELFASIPFFRYLWGILLQSLIVAVGFILFVVPGLIWIYKYMFTGFLIVDKGLRPVEALRQSGVLTQGAKRDLCVFSLLLGAINVLGALALLVGLLWTIPTSIVATAHVYRQLQRSQATPAQG